MMASREVGIFVSFSLLHKLGYIGNKPKKEKVFLKHGKKILVDPFKSSRTANSKQLFI